MFASAFKICYFFHSESKSRMHSMKQYKGFSYEKHLLSCVSVFRGHTFTVLIRFYMLSVYLVTLHCNMKYTHKQAEWICTC